MQKINAKRKAEPARVRQVSGAKTSAIAARTAYRPDRGLPVDFAKLTTARLNTSSGSAGCGAIGRITNDATLHPASFKGDEQTVRLSAGPARPTTSLRFDET